VLCVLFSCLAISTNAIDFPERRLSPITSSLLSRVQTGKFLAQVTRSHYASFLFKKVVISFGKIRSPVQSAAEFHERNFAWIEHVLFLPVLGASFFLYQKKAPETPFTVTPASFSGARNLRRKLASLTAALGSTYRVERKLYSLTHYVLNYTGYIKKTYKFVG